MTDHLTPDERRQMVRGALKELAQKKLTAEINLVILQGNSDRKAELAALQKQLREIRQGIANLEAQYAELLAELMPDAVPEQAAANGHVAKTKVV